MVGLGEEASFGMHSFETQPCHHLVIREAMEGLDKYRRLGNALAEIAERPALDDCEGVLNDGSCNEQVEETERRQAGFEGIFPGLDSAGRTVPARLQFQAQCRFDDSRSLQIPGNVRNRSPSRNGVDEWLVTDVQRALHRMLLGVEQP